MCYLSFLRKLNGVFIIFSAQYPEFENFNGLDDFSLVLDEEYSGKERVAWLQIQSIIIFFLSFPDSDSDQAFH